VDFKMVAFYFGQGATYDAIEGRFRVAKKQALKLKQEAEQEGRAVPVRGTTATPTSTPKKPRSAASKTPTKAAGANSEYIHVVLPGTS
jgi:hypothetical protein